MSIKVFVSNIFAILIYTMNFIAMCVIIYDSQNFL
jgi:hypothetical protein